MRRPRKYLAWKLVQLAHRVHDPEWMERVVITTPQGKRLEINVGGDDYGSGISSTSGVGWNPTVGDPMTADIDGWTFEWHDPIPMKKYVEEL